jgi:hypothetical protein
MRNSILAYVLAALVSLVYSGSLWADSELGIPSKDFPVERYETLWTKSPFAVASTAPEKKDNTPAAYKLVGVSQFGGISYASVVNNQGGGGLFLEQNKPTKGLTLLSIQQGKTGATSSAKIILNGQVLVLDTDNTPQTSLPQPVGFQPGNPGNPGGIRREDFVPRFPIRRQLIQVPPQSIAPASATH